ncbi:MAG: GNAT family N-acetyltransferase [Solirubrobacteraceae bacterium]
MPARSAATPTVETERLRLRAWRPGDVSALARIVADPEVTRYLHLPGSESPAQTVGRLRHHWDEHGFGHWAVEAKASGDLIGRLGLLHHRDWEPDPHNVEVGWILARCAWGKGLATEGGRAALRYGFDRIGLPDIISIADPANRASRRVMEKLGLSPAGTARWRGVDVVWYSIDRRAPG